MAKFAQVRYGSQGQGPQNRPNDTYTYVVNDNVRTQDKIQVVSTSKKGNKFATTALTMHTYKENSVKGQNAKVDVLARGDKGITKAIEQDIKSGKITQSQLTQMAKDVSTQSYTGKELGMSQKGVSKNQYQQDVRGANLAMYKQANPNATLTPKAQETFDSYSKQFMKGEQ